jgi:hypothetical protein
MRYPVYESATKRIDAGDKNLIDFIDYSGSFKTDSLLLE